MIPKLDPAPSGRPNDYQFLKIQEVKGVTELVFPSSFMNKYANKRFLAHRDQDDRGTCVGQSSAYIRDILYLDCTQDFPTDADRAALKRNVVDSLGTIHDELYPNSFSAESIYQVSRRIGNVTYPSGSEIRYAARAMKDYGANLEPQWHTAKKPTNVWDVPRVTSDGGMSEADAKAFALEHVIDGWAMCGRSDGYATWDQICYSIFTKGCVLGAIPVFSNYMSMQGGDGAFPDPKGDLAGYHALAFIGYDEDHLYFLHSWGDWCGMLGSISKRYFNASIDQSVWMVILDKSERAIGKQISRSIEITSDVPCLLWLDGVMLGYAPQTISCLSGERHEVRASADGYIAQVKMVDDGVRDKLVFALESAPAPGGWYRLGEAIRSLVEWLTNLFRRK